MPATSGRARARLTSRRTSTSRTGILDDEELATLAELRPEDENGLVAARRVFADGRTRAYAWGRAVPREELAALVERLLAMSGQFEQRRLARPSFQLDVLDAFVGEEQVRLRADHARAWRELAAARRHRDELASAEAGRAERLEELRQLVERTEGLAPDTEDALRSERERLRHVTELAEAATEATEALSSEQSETGAVDQLAKAANALMPVTNLAPELQAEYVNLGDLEERLKDVDLLAPRLSLVPRGGAGAARGGRGRARAHRGRTPSLRRRQL